MHTCEFCNKTFSTSSALKSHVKYCRCNPDRIKKYPDWVYDLDDDRKLYSKYLNKRNNAKHENINFDLSYMQYCQLVNDANLHSSDLGFSGRYYVLARYNDSGDYTWGNCRFITQLENAHERKLSNKAIQASKCSAHRMNTDPEIKLKRMKRMIELSKDPNSRLYKYRERQHAAKIEHYQQYRSQLDPRFCEHHNSQYGSYWITDGKTNMKWRDSKGSIPEGFYRGRRMKLC